MFVVSRRRRTLDIWPGFVDALAALLMVVVFVLLLFTLGQYFLNQRLENRETALSQLNEQVARLADMLSMEKSRSARLGKRVEELQASLAGSREHGESLQRQLQEAHQRLGALGGEVESLQAQRESLSGRVSELGEQLSEERKAGAEARDEVARLNRQIGELRRQLTQVSQALDLSKQTVEEQKAKIEDLGERLNVALAEKVEQLKEYRSEFFGRLKKALGDNPDIRVVGDRFVFQSELLFDTASADLDAQGRSQVRKLADTLKEVMHEIPDDIDWVLRVDGHTDTRPINTDQFPSNWELSTARALAIVHYLQRLGIPPGRMAATGFGEYHPLDDRDTPEAWARNRRIELKLTSR